MWLCLVRNYSQLSCSVLMVHRQSLVTDVSQNLNMCGSLSRAGLFFPTEHPRTCNGSLHRLKQGNSNRKRLKEILLLGCDDRGSTS